MGMNGFELIVHDFFSNYIKMVGEKKLLMQTIY